MNASAERTAGRMPRNLEVERAGGRSPPNQASIGERLRRAAAARPAAAFAILLCASLGVRAGVLPEDRADVLYHYYDGGGVQIDGPSVLVRKSVGQDVSLNANYYVDSVSSASIDVITQASRYSEERKESTLGVDYLHRDTTLSLAWTKSDENDYRATTWNLGLSQEVFGGLTTLSMGYGRGSDDVGKRGTDFSAPADHWHYRLGLSQVLTRNLIASLDFEAVADEGFLNNPYRRVRYADAGSATGYSYQAEVYPRTRDSSAVALRGRYYLPYRAALSAGYRYYDDSWGISASTVEVGYTQPWRRWTFELGYRYYTQGAADFYSDLFPYADAQNFLARDKELASFSSQALRLAVGYEMPIGFTHLLDKGAINLVYDHFTYDYDNFRDLRVTGTAAGSEPLYGFSANVLQLFFSVWF